MKKNYDCPMINFEKLIAESDILFESVEVTKVSNDSVFDWFNKQMQTGE